MTVRHNVNLSKKLNNYKCGKIATAFTILPIMDLRKFKHVFFINIGSSYFVIDHIFPQGYFAIECFILIHRLLIVVGHGSQYIASYVSLSVSQSGDQLPG